jgi:Na+ dependent nucleoside transporter N-terminus
MINLISALPGHNIVRHLSTCFYHGCHEIDALELSHTGVRVYTLIPPKTRTPLAALVTLIVMCVSAFITEESAENTRANCAVSLFGLLVMIFVLWATSRDRKRIQWYTVIGGMLTQFAIVVFVLRTTAGYDIFNFISGLARDLLGFANKDTAFLTATSVTELGWLLTGVVPPIIFVTLVPILLALPLYQHRSSWRTSHSASTHKRWYRLASCPSQHH